MQIMKTGPRSGFVWALCLAVVAIAAGACLAVDQPAGAAPDGVVAKVGSIEITQEQLEEELAAQLQEIERQRHEVLQNGMENAIEQALLDLEAEARGVAENEMLRELYADLDEPTEEEIDAFYEERKARINRPKEEVVGQIRNYLRQQERRGVYGDFIKELRGRYAVERYLEPWRTEVAEGGGPAMGPDTAPVTIIEFSDFQCPYCQRLAPTIDKIKEDYGDQVRVVFRQFPLPIHDNAQKAAEASLCANEEGKFWEMHDAMFANIRALGVDQLKQKAAELGLNAETFADCLDSGKFADQVATDLSDGRAAGVSGTPAMFVNGRFLSGAVPYDQIAAVIDEELERGGEAAP
jgi:protein-disulfide isomerase